MAPEPGQADLGGSEAGTLFRAAFDACPTAMAVVTASGRLAGANRTLTRLLGLAEHEIVSADIADLVHPGDRDCFAGVEPTGNGEPSACRLLAGDGEAVWVEVRVTPIDGFEAEGPAYRLVVFEDGTERRKAEDHLAYLANFDTLTGLLNRQAFWRFVRRQSEEGAAYAVVMLDLDRFRQVAESIGHDRADAVIREVGARLRSRVPRDAGVARIGADAFAVVIADADDVVADGAAQSVHEGFASPMAVDGSDVFVTASVGVANAVNGSRDPDVVVQEADAAMAVAKRAGGNCVRRAETGPRASRSYFRLVGELRRALDRREFRLHYQPQIDLRSGRLLGVEALLRWDRPGRGLVPPGQFVSILEETGLIVPVGRWVLREACTQLAQWHDDGLDVPRVAVNLSGRQLDYASLPRTVRSALDEARLHPSGLQLELTEDWLMEDPDECIATLASLRQMGVSVAVDDFGTGYSSLAYLRRFRVDALKLDRSFVRDLPEDVEARAIVEAVLALARTLNLCVTAEGVERREQRDFLAGVGCDAVQGFLHSPALPPGVFEEWVRTQTCDLMERP